MMYLGDDFSRDETINGLYTPEQEAILNQMANDLDEERIEMFEHDAEIQMMENMLNSGILQPQDL